MIEGKLFYFNETSTSVELIYYAERSLMPARDLGEAIVGMSTCLKIAGRTTKVDFLDIYIFPIEEGSIKTRFAFTKRDAKGVIVGVVATVAGTLIIQALNAIGSYGLAFLKNPSGQILNELDKNVIALCMNGDFRRSVGKIAQPIGEHNQKVTIRTNGEEYEITCDNQYKFLISEDEPILPELRNGETVSLVGSLTRMNIVPKNDLGFKYKDRILSISPKDKDKNVAMEYHQFTPLPQIVVTGTVVRDSDFVVPEIKVIRIDELKDSQIKLFQNDINASESGQL